MPTAYTLKAKLEAPGIQPSHRRSGGLDDNAYMEAWFRNAKYPPIYPTQGFPDIGSARAWALRLVIWYNGRQPAQHDWVCNAEPAARRRSTSSAGRLQTRVRDRPGTKPRRWSRGVRRWNDPEHVSESAAKERTTGKIAVA
jgi:putative transposase